ncbi:Protein of unknown function [Saccharopolyspora shandongensis]|uniref:Heparan-alpha-glucosaminide N-acetyltransferase catalytic domain-containing protein n=1 Tax=Saccharopolyspora shandongensis TaxID=418495 RepID=A0A1H3EP15_9PSEU|nr:heparan-alpha-glucosaminide N-acetyltransferase domain-containing protein [Saccharopolyspora shandongensis]SDX80461.1 Protein of unknown function [Saccharopolyspora shandongensis]
MVHANESRTAAVPGAVEIPDPRAVRPRARLSGVDLARALAVLGMFIAHIGPAMLDPRAGTAAEVLAKLGNGHASILFATLAGVSLALLTGGSDPHDGALLRRDRVRIAVRAAILFVLGMALTQLGTPIMVILSFYAIYFVLALPVLRMPPAALAVLAGVWALVAPQVSFLIRRSFDSAETAGGALSFSDLASLQEAGAGLLRLLLDGAYPVLTWMPFVFVGIAVGRLDLRSTAVRLRLLAAGAGAAVAGYGGSWLALNVFGGMKALSPLLDALSPIAAELGKSPLELLHMSNFGTVPARTPALLLLAAPHSGTTFEIVGSTGTALAVLALCLFAGDRLGRVLAPLTAVGALALTVYTAQAVALKILADTAAPAIAEHPWLPLIGFALVSMLFCGLWRPFLGRGPLERVLHRTSVRVAAAVAR